MIEDNVQIFTKKRMDQLNPRIKEAVNRAIKEEEGKTYPLYKEFSGNLLSKTPPKENSIIGAIANLHITKEGELRATVTINPVLASSADYQGVVDNLKIKVTPSKKRGAPSTSQLIGGVIYSRYAKEVIDQKNKEKEMEEEEHKYKGVVSLTDAPKESYVAPYHDDTVLPNSKVMQNLFNNLAKQEEEKNESGE